MFCISRIRRLRWLVAVALVIPCLHIDAGQFGIGGIGASRGRKRGAAPMQLVEAPQPQLLNADTNPTLRYPVAVRESSVSCGWLDVTQSGVNYTVVESAKKGKGQSSRKYMGSADPQYWAAQDSEAEGEDFTVASSELKSAKLVKNLLQLNFAKRSPLLIYLPQVYCGAVVGKSRTFDEYAQINPTGTMAVQRGVQNFAAVLAEVKPPAPPPLDVSLRADPPAVERGRPVNLVWSSKNATSLDLEPGVGQVSSATGMISQVPQDSTNYTLTAMGPAGSKSVSVYVSVTSAAPASTPTIVLIEPAVSGEGQSVDIVKTPLVIRGVVMDASGIPVVTVNGKLVSMRPTSAQAAQFTSDPVDLQTGENRFEVVAVNTAKAQAKVAFSAHFSASPPKAPPAEPAISKGLAKAEILSLLQGDVSSARVAALVKQRGIKFVPTPDDLKAISAAGGGDELIDAINQAASAAKN